MQLEELGCRVKSLMRGDTVVVVTDENVERLYLDRCMKSLLAGGLKVHSFVIPPGEDSKSGAQYLELLNILAGIPLTRADALVALGGGVVGDLTGFAAATYLRGIKIVQVPTTLLSAVDSSVGGKTAINLSAGKNLAGAFHQPILVWRDTSLLESLPENILRDGMAEVIKAAVIADEELFRILSDLGSLDAAKGHLESIIERCVKIKEEFVAEDEHDTGARQLLNFGHTIGHAVETATDFSVSHGSAVAKGMAAMADISQRQGWCSCDTSDDIKNILLKYGFDINIEEPKEALYAIMKSDKKRKGQYIDIVVPAAVGKCRLERLTTEQLKEIL